MRVLIIKMSSMGDVIHTLPAITDLITVHPEITIDWVVEDSFKEIPLMHPAVNEVIPISLRKWRKEGLIAQYRNGVIPAFIKKLRTHRYDYIIDPQGLFKSAMVTRLAHGQRVGLGRKTSREFGFHFLYHQTHDVPKEQHAVEKIRQFFAKVFAYSLPTLRPDYGIKEHISVPPAKKPYLVFLVNTTWKTKLYPEPYWVEIGKLANEQGYDIFITSGNADEKARADRIAGQLHSAMALPRQSITNVAKLIQASSGVFSVDTGFAHLTAALAKHAVSIYGATDSDLTGAYGYNQQRVTASYLCSPCLEKKCFHSDQVPPYTPPCYRSIPPSWVWDKFLALVGGTADHSEA